MSNLPPLDVKDGVQMLLALTALHDVWTEFSALHPDMVTTEMVKSLERANAAIQRLLESVDAKAR